MAKRVIALMGQPIQNEDAAAAEAITPGHLVSQNTSGLWVKHPTAAGAAPRTFAMERDEMGKGIDDAYAIGDTVKVGAFTSGMRVNAIIGVVTTTIGGMMESAGNGTLRNVTAGFPIARALEVVANGAGTARCRVEIV
jgi:hypothetical protein